MRRKCASRFNAITFTRVNLIVRGWINYYRIGQMKGFIERFRQWPKLGGDCTSSRMGMSSTICLVLRYWP
ncbi:group II intron maturase-specific domain-containing protein [Sharpea azabuensis]|uniref:group II intron maturase-specific domain-containing protein n=1 Tax=Sharpea azabuensis TaxID=322505 RepID=UPI003C6F8DF3